ncbi:N-acetylmuramoyl-L-alanine amidase [Kaistella antarctica]|uniref:N-acetylmuramoyl-L-alanine amidase n=1 Tax=Kaistella antarctica TaxID=266748 RepID=A0A448NMA9_9FLAO|nr:N-acetylmuramoyl-L-alanine amidase [Kaistella antarctica]KEY20120.1 N-acetylmuramoyl-L-alanine amidase [Kaistella antarctica]SEV93424.1 N-acetylmuramoyl-L-alanine amidase [Kaistella antarctica]VEH95220.1 N-acetylmuramoyl-L-alanine amidase AmiD precursor [Kaistella antarctica]
MRKTLSIISLGFLIISCGTQKNTQTVVAKPTLPKVSPAKPVVSDQKPKVQREHGVDFFKDNIADVSKNDNTASYGSIVSANPATYKVVKTFYPSVGQNFRQKYIILHYTALDDDKSVMVLTQQSVSAHYLVNDLGDNEIYQLVDENKRAYHAGISAWRKDKMLNDTSIGIEIVNAGYKTDASGTKIFPEYSDAQVRKVAALVKDLANRYMVPATNILGHSDIAPTRKQDPGPKFPWKKLYDEYQVGMWYDEGTKQNFYDSAVLEDYAMQMSVPSFLFKIQTALRDFGYDLNPNGAYDDATKKTIETFQYHFRPQNYSGMMDAETWAILQALDQKYPNK